MEDAKAEGGEQPPEPAGRKWVTRVVVGLLVACVVFDRSRFAPRQFHLFTVFMCGVSALYFAKTPFQYRWGELLVVVSALSAQFGYALNLVEARVLNFEQATEIALMGLVATLFVWGGVILALKHFRVESSWARFAYCLLFAGGMAGIVLSFMAQVE